MTDSSRNQADGGQQMAGGNGNKFDWNKLFVGNWKKFIWGAGVASAVIAIWLFGSFNFASRKADEWGQGKPYYSEISPKSSKSQKSQEPQESQEFSSKTSHQDESLSIYLQKFTASELAEKARIQEQLEVISSQAKTHLIATRDFYIWSTVVPVTTLFSTILGACCLLHITRRGWDDASHVIQGIFVVNFATFSFTSSCILLFEYEVNIRNNAALYVNYVNLEQNIRTVLSTQATLSELSESSSLYNACKDANTNTDGQPDSSTSEQCDLDKLTLKLLILKVQEKLDKYNKLEVQIDVDRTFNVGDFLDQSGLEQ